MEISAVNQQKIVANYCLVGLCEFILFVEINWMTTENSWGCKIEGVLEKKVLRRKFRFEIDKL